MIGMQMAVMGDSRGVEEGRNKSSPSKRPTAASQKDKSDKAASGQSTS